VVGASAFNGNIPAGSSFGRMARYPQGGNLRTCCEGLKFGLGFAGKNPCGEVVFHLSTNLLFFSL
jgi:hypothetical protein